MAVFPNWQILLYVVYKICCSSPWKWGSDRKTFSIFVTSWWWWWRPVLYFGVIKNYYLHK